MASKLVTLFIVAISTLTLVGCAPGTLTSEQASTSLVKAGLCDEADSYIDKYENDVSLPTLVCQIDDAAYGGFFFESSSELKREEVISQICRNEGEAAERLLKGDNWVVFFNYSSDAYFGSVKEAIGGTEITTKDLGC